LDEFVVQYELLRGGPQRHGMRRRRCAAASLADALTSSEYIFPAQWRAARSLLRFKALTFEVVGTLIDFERGMLNYLRQATPATRVSDNEFLDACRKARERRAASPCSRATRLAINPVKPDWHFTTLGELADAVEAETAQQRQRTALRLFGGSLAMEPA